MKGDVGTLKAENNENRRKFSLPAAVSGRVRARGTEQDITEDGENGLEFSDGQMVFLDFRFNPSESIEGQMSFNVLGNVARKRPLEFSYGDRGLPLTIQADAAPDVPAPGSNSSAARLLSTIGNASKSTTSKRTFTGEEFDVTAFYHTPRFHWGFEGDFFGLVREATDTLGQDIWNAKAPSGIEVEGKDRFKGLKLLAGPEVYWGANPKFVVKYEFDFAKIDWAFIHSEDVARLDTGANATEATLRQSRQTTLYAKKDFGGGYELEIGGIMSATERVDEVFDRVDRQGNVFIDEIEFEDTLGLKAKFSFPAVWNPVVHWAASCGPGCRRRRSSHDVRRNRSEPATLQRSRQSSGVRGWHADVFRQFHGVPARHVSR